MSTDKVFKRNPNLGRYFKTSDGTPFYKKEHAKTHARGLKDKSVEEVVKPVAKVEADSKKASEKTEANLEDLTPMQKAKLRIRAIKKLDTVEAVKAALEGETAKTVIEAGELRIKAIQDVDASLNTTTNEEEE
ncbi:hypothetical protein [Formosa sp. S-31]|uniref:hypothetical protein n=1 Tax=Formosa sp. S-31 TaxID=2790949 RepID=UPI003EB74414